jgi:glycosyltransferase involved in cell wall biosynthesis
MDDILYLVIPCYNEEDVLPTTAEALKQKLKSLIAVGFAAPSSRILFVDDGSKDRTWSMIEQYSKDEPIITGIKLSHNRGHQNALMAGLMTAKQYADAVVSMDADLQDDMDVLDQFIAEYHRGSEIVYGVRSHRETDTPFKRFTAEAFYKLMRMIGVELVFNHADYRLLSKRALSSLEQYREVNLFLRGIVPMLGLTHSTVTYDRGQRAAGVSKYPLHKMISFAMSGITACSVKPLRLLSALGAAVTGVSLVAFLITLISAGNTASAETLCSIWFLGGIQLLSLGLVGEYVGNIYEEVKNRPRYLIESDLTTLKETNKSSEILQYRKVNP